MTSLILLFVVRMFGFCGCSIMLAYSVIFVNENEKDKKRENNEFVNEN